MTLLDVVAILLIPAGLLPVATFFVLFGYRGHPSPAARDRWHIAIVMALLGGVTSLLAVGFIFDLGLGDEWLLLFALALLTSDIISGKWLIDYYRGSFDKRSEYAETDIQREDRKVGDKRRDLQAKARAARDAEDEAAQ